MTLADLLSPASALFLDFDGTLVELAPRPDAIVLPEPLVPTLERLQHFLGGALAIVSGRPVGEIDRYLSPLRLPVAGVHGAERRTADGATVLSPAPPLELATAAARRLADDHPALLVESKRGSVALHYRQAPELEALCVAALQVAVEASPGLALLHGKMVVEAKSGGASKGRAIEAFLREPPFLGRTPVFVGDDVTDEAGFAAVQRLGGLGVKVGAGSTTAWQRVPDPASLREALESALARRPVQTVAP